MSFLSELDDLFREAHCTFTDASGAGLMLTYNGKSVRCVAGSPVESRLQAGTGWMGEMVRTVMLRRPDFNSLGIVDQTVVTVGEIAGRVVAIENDPADAMVTLRLSADV